MGQFNMGFQILLGVADHAGECPRSIALPKSPEIPPTRLSKIYYNSYGIIHLFTHTHDIIKCDVLVFLN